MSSTNKFVFKMSKNFVSLHLASLGNEFVTLREMNLYFFPISPLFSLSLSLFPSLSPSLLSVNSSLSYPCSLLTVFISQLHYTPFFTTLFSFLNSNLYHLFSLSFSIFFPLFTSFPFVLYFPPFPLFPLSPLFPPYSPLIRPRCLKECFNLNSQNNSSAVRSFGLIIQLFSHFYIFTGCTRVHSIQGVLEYIVYSVLEYTVYNVLDNTVYRVY